jgi:cell division septum initiation protein DivIVA
MSSKIEQVIDDIEAYIEGCKTLPFSSTDIRVNRDQIMELIRELRTNTPDEIKRYQKIISNKEAILNDAKGKAQELLEKAQVQTNELVNEHEIMRQAYEQANQVVSSAAAQAQQILDRANSEANNMKESAVQYTDTLLAEVENILHGSIESTNRHYEGMLSDLTNYEEIIRSNRAMLVPPEESPSPQAAEFAQPSYEQQPEMSYAGFNDLGAAQESETSLEAEPVDVPSGTETQVAEE